jgi:hypothetical protein
MRKFAIAAFVVACLSLVGCATLDGASKVYEGGRYGQLFTGDSPFMQVDWPTAQGCENALRSTKVEPGQRGISAKCAVGSLADQLPYGAVTTDLLLNTKRQIHFASPTLCEVFKAQGELSGGSIECTGAK